MDLSGQLVKQAGQFLLLKNSQTLLEFVTQTSTRKMRLKHGERY